MFFLDVYDINEFVDLVKNNRVFNLMYYREVKWYGTRKVSHRYTCLVRRITSVNEVTFVVRLEKSEGDINPEYMELFCKDEKIKIQNGEWFIER